MIRYGSVIRATMHVASMDVMPTFDVARPKHIARIMEEPFARDGKVRRTGNVRMCGEQTLLCAMHAPREGRSPQTLAENGSADLGKR